jgi:hypothetical protein
MEVDLNEISVKNCRVCGKELVPIMSLGKQFISDFNEEGEGKARIPLELVLCNASDGDAGCFN